MVQDTFTRDRQYTGQHEYVLSMHDELHSLCSTHMGQKFRTGDKNIGLHPRHGAVTPYCALLGTGLNEDGRTR